MFLCHFLGVRIEKGAVGALHMVAVPEEEAAPSKRASKNEKKAGGECNTSKTAEGGQLRT